MAEEDIYTQDGTVDINKNPADKRKTGNWKACRFILGNECCERLAYYGMSTNLVNYLKLRLNQGNVTASNNVTNWSGTCYITPLIGAFLADAYLGRYWTIAGFSIIYVFGMTLLTMSASVHGLEPSCDKNGNNSRFTEKKETKRNPEMAIALASRAAIDRTPSLLKLSFNFLRSFSTASPSLSAQNPNDSSSSASKKPKRKKKKNLFELAQFLPNWGIGYHMAKTHWTGVSYQITKINLYKDGRHGKAWGIVHKDGLQAADAPKKISGVHKRCWRYIPNLSKSTESAPNLTKSTETVPKDEVQAS